MLSIGNKVPDFIAQSNKGTIDSKSYRGKYLVIYFYPKDNTPGCTLQAKDFRDLYQDFLKQNCDIIGVSRDSMQSHSKFECKYELPFPLISDSDSKLCNLFSIIKPKTIFGNTALGIIRSTFLLDPNGNLVQEWRKVSVANHAQEVLESLKKLAV